MSIQDKIKKYVLNIFLARYLVQVKDYLKGKKTVTGAISLLLWVCIYAIPAFTPEYNWLTVLATQVRDTLQSSGIELDNTLFNTGLGFTVIGLIDKAISYFKKGRQ